jgi:hypothetical protein
MLLVCIFIDRVYIHTEYIGVWISFHTQVSLTVGVCNFKTLSLSMKPNLLLKLKVTFSLCLII